MSKVTLFFIMLAVLVATPCLSKGPALNETQSADGELEPITVTFSEPISLGQVPAELLRLGYSAHPFQRSNQKVMQVDNFEAGLSPEADCAVTGAVTIDGSRALIVFRLSNNLGVQNLSTYAWETFIPLSSSAVAVAVTPSGDYALVVSSSDDCVDVVNLTTWSVDQSIAVGGGPVAIDIASDGSRAIVLNSTDSTASIISLSTWTVERTITGVTSGVWTTTWNMVGRFIQEFSEVHILNDNVTAAVPTGPTVEFLDMSTGSLYTLTITTGTAKDMDVSRDGSLGVVAGDNDARDVNFINLAVQPPTNTGGFALSGHHYWGQRVQFSADGSLVALTQLPDGGGYTYLSLFQSSLPYNSFLYQNNGSSTGMALSPDGASLMSIGYNAVMVDMSGPTPTFLASYLANNAVFLAASSAAAIAVGGNLLYDEDIGVYDYSLAGYQVLDYGPAGQLPEGDCPRRLSLSADGSVGVSADYVSDSVAIFDPGTGTVTGIVPTGDRVFDVKISSDGATAFTCDYEEYQVTVVDVATQSVFAQLPAPRRPGNCEFSPDNTRAYAVTIGTSTDCCAVYDINGASSSHVADITIGNVGLFYAFGGWGPNPAVTSDGAYVVVPVSHSYSVAVIDTSALTVVANIDVSPYSTGYPYFATIDPTDSLALISDGFGDVVHVIQLAGASSTYLQSFSPGDYPFRLIYQADGQYVYCVNLYDENVAVIETTGYSVVTTVPLPGPPQDMTSSGNVLSIACDASGSPGDFATINEITMNGAGTTLDISYNAQYYGISIAAHNASDTALTACSGWDRYSWLHDVPQVFEPFDLIDGERLTADQIRVTWDALTCPSPCFNLIYGSLSTVSDYTLAGSRCDIGSTGSYDWTSVPGEDLFFLLVGSDCIDTESSWGTDSNALERNGAIASGECSVTTKDTSGICP